mmetsp:Transcript_21597/g.56090  ORF Transcript_21597/g.56090 Transcript_21597/m.56090 type:complete len:85 (+) Transcript_21597:1141-1395(+)
MQPAWRKRVNTCARAHLSASFLACSLLTPLSLLLALVCVCVCVCAHVGVGMHACTHVCDSCIYGAANVCMCVFVHVYVYANVCV